MNNSKPSLKIEGNIITFYEADEKVGDRTWVHR